MTDTDHADATSTPEHSCAATLGDFVCTLPAWHEGQHHGRAEADRGVEAHWHNSEPKPPIEVLVGRSSLGTPEAKRLRDSVDPVHARMIVRLSQEVGRAEEAEEQVRTLTAERESARDWAVRLEQELAEAEATVQRVRGLADRWADPWESDGMSGNAWIGMALTAAAERIHRVLDGTAQPGTDAATKDGE